MAPTLQDDRRDGATIDEGGNDRATAAAVAGGRSATKATAPPPPTSPDDYHDDDEVGPVSDRAGGGPFRRPPRRIRLPRTAPLLRIRSVPSRPEPPRPVDEMRHMQGILQGARDAPALLPLLLQPVRAESLPVDVHGVSESLPVGRTWCTDVYFSLFFLVFLMFFLFFSFRPHFFIRLRFTRSLWLGWWGWGGVYQRRAA